MPAFTDDEFRLMHQTMLNALDATPSAYFELRTGHEFGPAMEQVFDPFRATPKDQLTTTQLSVALECTKLSVMFVADWEYHARTGFYKEDALAFIVAMETTGQPPKTYPKGLG